MTLAFETVLVVDISTQPSSAAPKILCTVLFSVSLFMVFSSSFSMVAIDQAVVTASTTGARRNCGGLFQLAIDLGVQNRDGKRGSAGASGGRGPFCLVS